MKMLAVNEDLREKIKNSIYHIRQETGVKLSYSKYLKIMLDHFQKEAEDIIIRKLNSTVDGPFSYLKELKEKGEYGKKLYNALNINFDENSRLEDILEFITRWEKNINDSAEQE